MIKKGMSEFHCGVCNMSMTGEMSYNDHMRGKKHKRALHCSRKLRFSGTSKRVESSPGCAVGKTYSCSICGDTIDSPQIISHLYSHIKRFNRRIKERTIMNTKDTRSIEKICAQMGKVSRTCFDDCETYLFEADC